MFHPLLGAAYALSSRLITGETKIPEGLREELLDRLDQVKSYTDLVKDLDPTNPATWASSGISLLSHLLEGEDVYDSSWDYLRKNALSAIPFRLHFLAEDLLNAENRKVVYMDDWSVLFKVLLPNEVPIWIEWYPNSTEGRKKVYVQQEEYPLSQVYDGMAQVFWASTVAVEIDVVQEELESRPLDLSSYIYQGPLVTYIEQWRSFGEQDLRRNVLVQGKPGTGKTTFCYYTASQLSKRTLVLTHKFSNIASESQWKQLIDVTKPTLVVVNDIDRLGKQTLGSRLRMFEEGYCDIPFVLFTSNDIDKFPAAMLRPGRIDQKIVVSEPDGAPEPPGGDNERATRRPTKTARAPEEKTAPATGDIRRRRRDRAATRRLARRTRAPNEPGNHD